MADHDTTELTATASAQRDDPVAALGAAMVAAMATLAAQKVTPAHVTRLSIVAAVPARLHPSRTEVDLSLRETLGGFLPPIDVQAADGDDVTVRISARRPQPAPDGAVWGGYTLPELARQYSPRAFVPNMAAIFDAWRRDGAAFRNRHLTAELAYGSAREETLDFYWPSGKTGPLPLWVFIHGGYWQATDKAHHGQFMAGMLAAGYAVAVPNYTLAPHADLQRIVAQMQALVAFLGREARALGCEPGEIHLSGHSAGGHLCALLATLPDAALIRSTLPLSGLFDLAPLSHLAFASMLRIHGAESAKRLSPLAYRPLPHVRIGAAAGGAESDEFRRQTTDFGTAWRAPTRVIAGKHHFDLLDGLNGGELLDFARDIAAVGR
jgi:arylformamidase